MVRIETVDSDQLEAARQTYEAEAQRTGSGPVSTNAQFNYAYCLVHSARKEDIPRGLSLLQELCRPGTDQRDFCYYLALGNFRLGEFQLALQFIKRILAMEPTNRQAQELHADIQGKLKKDGILGMAIIGGVAAATVGLFLLARR